MWEVYYYCRAFEQLRQDLISAAPASKGFNDLCQYLKTYEESDKYNEMKTKVYALQADLTGFNLVFTFENDMITLSEEELSGTYEKFLADSFPGHKETLRSPFSGTVHLSNLEGELIGVFKKRNPKFFKELERFYKEYEDYSDDILLRFSREIGYYLAFYKFQEKMKLEGFEFTTPDCEEQKELMASGLYDLALACANYKIGKEVVSNNMVYHDNEQFFVVTGPNQGGKTTFARSLGQLIYFTKMGLDVPAVAANIPYFTNILTHFSVEESIATGRGKLKEELDRLAPMMCNSYENAFVIINELFTTAANYDACIMGKKVLDHFIAQNCRGVYVTHLKELSEDNAKVVSMKALVEHVHTDLGIKNIRRFKVLRSPADDLGYSDDLVNKHGLTYEQIKDRLEGGR